MTNVVLNRLRGRRPAEASLAPDGDGDRLPADPRSPDPVREAAASEAAAEIRVRLASLPEGWRAVLSLRYAEGLRVAEIAEALDLPVNTVKTRLFRAREALRGLLAPPGEEGTP
jgi:RNA polymerase sigma-70 factor (ECF subfamily)